MTLIPMTQAAQFIEANLIEDHNTTLIEIDRALKEDFSKEPEKRNLQLKAKPDRQQ